MTIPLKGGNFFTLKDFTPEEIQYLLDLTVRLRKGSEGRIERQDCTGEGFLLLFETNSIHTRCAFETSANDLGMGTMFLSSSRFGNTGTIKDSVRIFSEVCSAIGYRGAKHSTLLGMTEDSAVPIINGYTDHQHSTQMLTDATTLDEIWERENYKGKTLCFVGRGGTVNFFSYSVMYAILSMSSTYITSYTEMGEALEGLTAAEKATFRKFAPEGAVSPNWDMKVDVRERKIVEDLFAGYNPQCELIETDDINATKGVDVITTESQRFFIDPIETRLPRVTRSRPYQMNRELLERTENPGCIVTHMLPSTHSTGYASRQKPLSVIEGPGSHEFFKDGVEVTDEVSEQNAAYIFQEAGNRKHTTKAAIKAVLDERQRRNRLWTH